MRLAAKEKRIDYLLKISKDTLECIECNYGESWVLKEDFFTKYLEQIELSDGKEYNVYAEKFCTEKGFDKRYRISYAYGKGFGEKYNAIYTILEGKGGIQFQGVFSVP